MRIVHFNVSGAEAGHSFYYDHHTYHIIDELTKEGHEVIRVDPALELGPGRSVDEYSEVALRQMKELHRDKGIHLFFASAVDYTLSGEAIDEIRRMGIPTVNMNWDDLSHPYRVSEVTRHFDLVWTTVRENAHVIKSYGAKKLMVMPFAANPHFFKPLDVEEQRVVGFVGSCYGARARNLCTLAQSEVPVEVYGQSPNDVYAKVETNNPIARAMASRRDGWTRLKRSLSFKSGRQCVTAALKRSLMEPMSSFPEKNPHAGSITYSKGPSFEDMVRRLNEFALSLGSIELASTYVFKDPLLFIRIREFEAPMCGAVHLVNRMPELEEYFEEDKEMLFFDSPEEMVDKARFYLDPRQDVARQAIRVQARRRAEADHGWINRFRALGDELGLAF